MWCRRIYQVVFLLKKIETVFMDVVCVVCCSRDWRFKGYIYRNAGPIVSVPLKMQITFPTGDYVTI